MTTLIWCFSNRNPWTETPETTLTFQSFNTMQWQVSDTWLCQECDKCLSHLLYPLPPSFTCMSILQSWGWVRAHCIVTETSTCWLTYLLAAKICITAQVYMHILIHCDMKYLYLHVSVPKLCLYTISWRHLEKIAIK